MGNYLIWFWLVLGEIWEFWNIFLEVNLEFLVWLFFSCLEEMSSFFWELYNLASFWCGFGLGNLEQISWGLTGRFGFGKGLVDFEWSMVILGDFG